MTALGAVHIRMANTAASGEVYTSGFEITPLTEQGAAIFNEKAAGTCLEAWVKTYSAQRRL
jgi:catechol-2,3-dioxygenase